MSDTTYGEDLDKIKVELAHRRSEMANLAKQTVADLEPKIPVLQAKINTLTAEVNRLDTLIATKTKQSEYDEEYWRTHYEELEAKLNKAHDARTAMFKDKDDQYDVKDKEYADKDTEFESRENDIQSALNRLTALNKELDERKMDFEQEKFDHKEKAHKIMDDINSHIKEANAEKMKQKSITENLEKQSLELDTKIKEADATIMKIGESQAKLDAAQKILDAAYTKEQDLVNHSKLLEATQQEIKEKNVILANRSTRLDQQEARLHQRTRHVMSLEEQKKMEVEDKNARANS